MSEEPNNNPTAETTTKNSASPAIPPPSVPTSLAQACDPTSSLIGGATSNFGTIEAVQLYLQRNARNGVSDITSFRDGEGRTALHWAISFKNFDLANALLYGPYKEEALMMMKSGGGVMNNKKDDDEDDAADQHHNKKDDASAADIAAAKKTDDNDNSSSASSDVFCAPWALPPDTSGTSVVSTACAVGAAVGFVQDLITIATGLPAPHIGSPADPGSIVLTASSSSSTSSSSDAAVASAAAQQKQLRPAQHPLFDAVDSSGNTAMHIAASRGNMKLVTLLLAYGTDVRSPNKRNQTCLHRLIGRGDVAAVESLLHFARKKFPLAVKSFVNAADANGDTALHYASMEENKEMGEFLLQNGANRDLRNKQGKEFWQL